MVTAITIALSVPCRAGILVTMDTMTIHKETVDVSAEGSDGWYYGVLRWPTALSPLFAYTSSVVISIMPPDRSLRAAMLVRRADNIATIDVEALPSTLEYDPYNAINQLPATSKKYVRRALNYMREVGGREYVESWIYYGNSFTLMQRRAHVGVGPYLPESFYRLPRKEYTGVKSLTIAMPQQ